MVERAGLENRNTRKRIVGSNPTLSATKKRTALKAVFLLWVLLALGPLAYSADKKAPALAPEVEAFVAEMVQKHGFEEKALHRLFLHARARPAIIKAMSAPGTARPWYEFRSRYLEPGRINAGVAFWRANADTLARASQEYGIPEEILVATIGVETYYGRHTGGFKVLDAIVTIAFHYPPRAELFRSELEQFLLLGREDHIDLAGIRGSYAGAMGIPQFLPSSYRRFAVDFDGDGKRDLIRSRADAIGSVANYYKTFGWRPGEAVVVPAEADKTTLDALLEIGIKPQLKIADLKARGVVPLVPVDDSTEAALITAEGETGPRYWLGLNNFYVITRYNRSVNYALTVHDLAQELRARMAQ